MSQPLFYCQVDILQPGYSLVIEVTGLLCDGTENTVDYKPVNLLFYQNGRLPNGSGKLHQYVNRLLGGVGPPHHLHQFHDQRRIEKVEVGHPLRMAHRAGKD